VQFRNIKKQFSQHFFRNINKQSNSISLCSFAMEDSTPSPKTPNVENGPLTQEEQALRASIESSFTPGTRAFMLKAVRKRMLERRQKRKQGARQKSILERLSNNKDRAATELQRSLEKQKVQSYIYGAALDIVSKQDETLMGRLPFKFMQKTLKKWDCLARINQKFGEVSPSSYLHRDSVRCRVRTLRSDAEKERRVERIELWKESSAQRASLVTDEPPDPPVPPPVIDLITVFGNNNQNNSEIDNGTMSSLSPSPNKKRKNGGRPQGAINMCTVYKKYKGLLAEATKKAAEIYQAEKAALPVGKRMVAGRVDKIISEQETVFGLSPSKGWINKRTVITRVQRNNPTGLGEGQISPLQEIEPLLSQYIQRLGEMREPLDQTNVIALACDLVRGTEVENKLIIWKKKYSHWLEGSSALIGPGWYSGFKKRYSHELKLVKAMNCDTQRATWCQYQHFEAMYDHIYKRFVEAGVASKRIEPIWQDITGMIVPDESQAFGLQCEYEVKEPEWIVFVDECGANTNQKSDGQVGGSRFLVGKDQVETGLQGAVNDLHFTTLCFQSGNGKPIMVAIILKSDKDDPSQLPLTWTAGLDLTKEIQTGSSASEWWTKNTEEGGAMSGGPTCLFRGVRVPCFIGCSPKASITSVMLRDMLKCMDDLGIWKRVPGGPVPSLILDGHHSRMELPFLDYITTKKTEWNTNIGVPYETHFWQLGDASECNGNYKMGVTRAKQEIYTKKPPESKGWKQSDIVPIVKMAFAKSFANVTNVKKAIAQRGWGPLNRALLLHPDIAKTKVMIEPTIQQAEEQEDSSSSSSQTRTLHVNVEEGSSSTLLDKLLQNQMKNEGRMKRMEEQKKKRDEVTSVVNKLQDVTRITSGVLAARGHFALDKDVRDAVARGLVAKAAQDKKAQEKRDAKEKKGEEKYNKSKAKETAGLTLTLEDLKTLCKEERRDDDPSKTKLGALNKKELRAFYAIVQSRRTPNLPSPPSPPSPPPSPPETSTAEEETEQEDHEAHGRNMVVNEEGEE
jgi:hypothetical protein